MRVVPFLPCHTEYAAKAEELLFPDPWSRDGIENELEKASSVSLAVIDDEGHFAGYLFASDEDCVYIEKIGVLPEYRRKGCGTALMDALCSRCPQDAVLDVRVSNTSAIAFYERLGFERLALRKRFYSSPAEDGYTYIRRKDQNG